MRMMAYTLKRRGIAISNRPLAKRRKSFPKRDQSRTSKLGRDSSSEPSDIEWPLKGILREKKNEYLVQWADHPNTGEIYAPTWVEKFNVGIAAIEEWEAEKQRRENQRLGSAAVHREKGSAVPGPHEQDQSAGGTDHRVSYTVTTEGRETPKTHRPRYFRKRIVISSPLSIEIPETQQELLSKEPDIVVHIYRPVDFHSQDYSTVVGSQAESNIATQDTEGSRDITKEDSTLGSSLPPELPGEQPINRSPSQESFSLVLLSDSQAIARSPHHSATSVPIPERSLSTSVDLPRLWQEPESHVLELLVGRSDPAGEADIEQLHSAKQLAQHTNDSLPSSPLFVSDGEDFDLQPITDPYRLGKESETEGELEILPAVNSPVSSGKPNTPLLRATRSQPKSSVAATGVELSRRESQFRPLTFNTPHGEAGPEESNQSVSPLAGSVRLDPARSSSTESIHISTSTSSARFCSQLSLSDAPAALSGSHQATARVQTPQRSAVTVLRAYKTPVAHPSPGSVRQLAFLTSQTPTPVSHLLPPASLANLSVRSSASPSPSIVSNMPDSHRESSPRVRRPPSAQAESTPELGLREKLRQIRAASRANQTVRSRSQVSVANSQAPTTTTLETRSSRRLSPGKNSQPVAASSTPTEDRPIPSLEILDGAAGEMELDKVDLEPSLSSSLPPPQPVPDEAPEKNINATQDHKVEKTFPELDIPTMPLLQASEFVVPLPIDGRVKHQYLAELAENYNNINNFLDSPRSSRLIDVMTGLIKRLNDTVVHTDLGLNGPATQIASTREEVLWAEDASSKFAFLAHMINILHGANHHIVVVARSGPTQDLLHSYLRGKVVNCQQGFGTGSEEQLREGDPDDPMRYTLLSTRKDSLKNVPRSASLIIAFDDSFDTGMLPEWCSTTQFVPVLLLLVVNSAEHVGRCIPQDVPEPERLRRLIKAVVHVHKSVGDMPFHTDFRHAFNLDQGARLAFVKKDHQAKIAHAAERTAEALTSKNFALNFTLQPISELDLEGLEDHPLSMEGSNEVSSSASRAGTPGGHKRVRDERSSSAIQAKRQRLTPLRDMTHISDSLKNSHSQSQIGELKQALRKAQQEASEERKGRLQAEEATTYTHARIKEITQSLGELQYRYESRTKQVHELKHDKQRSLTEREAVSLRLEKLQSENIALKDQRLRLQEELSRARDALTRSTIPGIAELEATRALARQAADESSRLRSSLANTRHDFEFTRSQYQDASTTAAELAAQVSELESQNAELKRLASDERRRLAELNYREDRKRDLARVEELEMLLGNREVVLARVEEELKGLRKGRGVVTRGSSVQPGSGVGGGSGTGSPRLGGGGFSRAGSPALGGGAGGGNGHAHGPVGGRASVLRNER